MDIKEVEFVEGSLWLAGSRGHIHLTKCSESRFQPFVAELSNYI